MKFSFLGSTSTRVSARIESIFIQKEQNYCNQRKLMGNICDLGHKSYKNPQQISLTDIVDSISVTSFKGYSVRIQKKTL